jgi:hypothetical protein
VQVPLPEQDAAAVAVPALHEAAPQLTLVEACVQAPRPLQLPVFPQVPLAGHWPDGAAVPAVIGAQLPSPLTLQA